MLLLNYFRIPRTWVYKSSPKPVTLAVLTLGFSTVKCDIGRRSVYISCTQNINIKSAYVSAIPLEFFGATLFAQLLEPMRLSTWCELDGWAGQWFAWTRQAGPSPKPQIPSFAMYPTRPRRTSCLHPRPRMGVNFDMERLSSFVRIFPPRKPGEMVWSTPIRYLFLR